MKEGKKNFVVNKVLLLTKRKRSQSAVNNAVF